MKNKGIYGIGNPLMDVMIHVSDKDIEELNLEKGGMYLIDDKQREKLLEKFSNYDKKMTPGGSCPNTIIGMNSLGTPTVLCGKVGDDEYGKGYKERLEKLGVKSSLSVSEKKTGISIVLVTQDAERTMNTYLGANKEFNIDDIDKEQILESEFLYFTGYMWDTDNQKDAVMKAIEIAQENGTKIIFDVADSFVVERNKEEFLKLIEEHSYLVFANSDEAKMLFDTDDSKEATEKLSEIANIAVVKCGSQGSLIKENGHPIIQIPINEVNAIDTTGAGDTYAAGFLFALHKEYSLRSCGHFASYLASQVVTITGAQLSEEMFLEILKKIDNLEWLYEENK